MKLLEKLDLKQGKQGERVEIELKKSITERTFGIIQQSSSNTMRLKK